MTLKEDMANTVTGINPRGSRWYVTILIPPDLVEVFGKKRINPALGTSDRREATKLATIKRAEWLAIFDVKRRELKPVSLAVVTPELSQELALRVRARVLRQDDWLRDDSSTLAPLTDAIKAREHQIASRLHIGSPSEYLASDRNLSPSAGLSDDDAETLAGLNALLDAKAGADLAKRRRAAVLPMVRMEALKLGLAFDPEAAGAQDALAASLLAYRKARQEVALRDSGEVIETPAVREPTFSTAAPKPSASTLRHVYERWTKSGDAPRSKDSIAAYGRALAQFEGRHPGLMLPEVTRELGDRYRSWLMTTAKTPKTARDRLTAIKSLLKYGAETLQWIPVQPWRSLDIKAGTTNKRRPWADLELQALFNAPLHAAYALPKPAYAGKDASYWIPLLGLYTGSRLGELCQLRTADIREVEGIAVLTLTDAGEGQKIKSEAGHRLVPIHSELIRLGFVDYANAMRDAGHDSLWPALQMRKDKASDYFGRWFLDHRKSLGIVGTRPDFHCFRHTVRPLMRRAGISDGTQDKVTGHKTQGSIGNTVYDHWTLQEIQAAVETIRHPVLALPQVSPYGRLDVLC